MVLRIIKCNNILLKSISGIIPSDILSPNGKFIYIQLSTNSLYLDEILRMILNNLTNEENSDLMGCIKTYKFISENNHYQKRLLHGYYCKIIEL
jgi:hypothetical protein